jgi:hypothetical protein
MNIAHDYVVGQLHEERVARLRQEVTGSAAGRSPTRHRGSPRLRRREPRRARVIALHPGAPAVREDLPQDREAS